MVKKFEFYDASTLFFRWHDFFFIFQLKIFFPRQALRMNLFMPVSLRFVIKFHWRWMNGLVEVSSKQKKNGSFVVWKKISLKSFFIPGRKSRSFNVRLTFVIINTVFRKYRKFKFAWESLKKFPGRQIYFNVVGKNFWGKLFLFKIKQNKLKFLITTSIILRNIELDSKLTSFNSKSLKKLISLEPLKNSFFTFSNFSSGVFL